MLVGLVLVVFLAACGVSDQQAVQGDEHYMHRIDQSDNVLIAKHAAFRPLPLQHDEPADLSALGERLFHDARLSKDMSISCASCHLLDGNGADVLPVSLGVGGQLGNVNTPTVFNSTFNFRQFWDGRAASLEDQVDGPVRNEIEMGNTWDVVIRRLSQDTSYRVSFSRLFSDDITARNIQTAIASFERTLITPSSAFDRYLMGDISALSALEVKGLETFEEMGCASCHQGINVGGNLYQYIGLMDNYFEDRGNIQPADYGLYNLTGLEEDRFKFKVPSLRNVAVTAPYFHDGHVSTLEDAIAKMAYYQLGIDISLEDMTAIVAFLNSLSAPLLREEAQVLAAAALMTENTGARDVTGTAHTRATEGSFHTKQTMSSNLLAERRGLSQ
jgi:cytochrome c peroxidase